LLKLEEIDLGQTKNYELIFLIRGSSFLWTYNLWRGLD